MKKGKEKRLDQLNDMLVDYRDRLRSAERTENRTVGLETAERAGFVRGQLVEFCRKNFKVKL